MHLEIIALVFGVIFIAELPDKSLFASLIMGTRFHSFHVWLGSAAAFLTHVLIAVTAGRLLTLLPHWILELIIAFLFLAGAGLIFFGKHGLEETPEIHKPTARSLHSFRKVFAMSYGVVFIGEWGDITQIATTNYAAKYHDTFNVAIGATLALWAVAALAIVLGAKALNVVSPKVLQRTTALILLAFGIWSVVSIFR